MEKMKPQVYRNITNACLALAIASALLWNRAGHYGLAVGSVGILAGLTASAAYLYNSWGEREHEKVTVAGETLKAMPTLHIVAGESSLAHHGAKKRLLEFAKYEQRGRHASHLYVQEAEEFCARTAGIIKRLSAYNEQAYEFKISPDGYFTIRPMSRFNPAAESAPQPENQDSLRLAN
jgi:hypothetical protein